MTVLNPFNPVPFVATSIGPRHNPLSVTLVLIKLAIVLIPTCPKKAATTLLQLSGKLSDVAMTIVQL
jgi:hypothetical protein